MARGLDLLELGRVVKAHGLVGELVVAPHGGCQEALQRLERLYLRRGAAKPRPWAVAGVRGHGARLLVALEGLDGRDRAEVWRDAAVLGRARDVAAADPARWGALLWLGRAVVLADGRRLGELEAVTHVAGQELWTIAGPDGRFVVPAALRRGEAAEPLVLDLPDGLLECCRQDETAR